MPLQKLVVPGCREQAAAIRMLIGNAAILLLCLGLQIVILCIRGPSCSVWPVYVGTLVVLLCVVLVAIAKACDEKLWRTWLRAYAWIAQIGIVTMVAADYLSGGREFPWIMFLLPVGMLSLGVSLDWHALIPYAIVSVIVLVLAGIFFGQMDNAIAAIAILVVIALPVIEISEVKRDIEVLRKAIKVVVNGKREDNR